MRKSAYLNLSLAGWLQAASASAEAYGLSRTSQIAGPAKRTARTNGNFCFGTTRAEHERAYRPLP